MAPAENNTTGLEIAIIGMAGRFSGSCDLHQFWHNLVEGVEGITFFSEEELLAAGVNAGELNRPNYIRARGILDAPEAFDADFFGIIPKEAELTDPQHRAFLECAWEAFEDAGHVPELIPGLVGVFAGVAVSTYFFTQILPREGLSALGDFLAFLSNDKDYLPTRVSYKLNLKGPSMAISTACSSSLVAVHVACKSLLGGECDMALAGGASIPFPVKAGYLFHEGGIVSPDGHCRTFDEEALGSVFGSGVGAVVLKRLEDALSDGDHIYAIIKGSAINNDGLRKVGFTAPSVDGQAEAIRLAHLMAEVTPETISYVEAHGSGTAIGDPIEVRALAEAFRQGTERKQFCAIGSVKTNIGHAAEAAGIAGLIKTALALKHRKLPPSLNCNKPNPKLDLENTAFYVNSKFQDCSTSSAPLRAGVSSFGMGGTNAHAVLEEAPVRASGPWSRSHQILTLSARSASALENAVKRLHDHLELHRESDLADISFTCHVGRKAFSHRRAIVCRDIEEAIRSLADCAGSPGSSVPSGKELNVGMMFSGLGEHYRGMAAELYYSEPVFRAQVDRCVELLQDEKMPGLLDYLLGDTKPAATPDEIPKPKIDFLKMLGRNAGGEAEPAGLIQTALFVMEYALARLWMHWGLQPKAMVGYSIGEFVAACIAEVFTLEDALRIVARRGHLVELLPGGAMLAVPLPEQELRAMMGSSLSVTAVNGPSLGVVAGPIDEIERLQLQLKAAGVDSRRVQSSHAFHSRMMEPSVGAFADIMREFPLAPPKVPYLSNVTGDWITGEQACNPQDWANHLCRPVRFGDAIEKLCDGGVHVLLEVGPGHMLTSLTLQHPASRRVKSPVVLASLPSRYENDSSTVVLSSSFAKLWEEGWVPDWAAFHQGEQRIRVSLPSYPFERKIYRLEPTGASYIQSAGSVANKKSGITERRSQNSFAELTEHEQSCSFASLTGEEQGRDPIGVAAPENALQATILEIWRQLFGIQHIGIHDNFFHLGGDSLRATQLISRLSEKLSVAVPLRQFFEKPTVAELATAIHAIAPDPARSQVSIPASLHRRTGGRSPSDFPRVEISKRELDAILNNPSVNGGECQIEDLYPLTSLQQGMLFHVLGDPESSLYLNQQSYTFKTDLAAGALKMAFQELVGRHQILRTGFVVGPEKGPLQVVYQHADFPWEEYDWRHLSPAEQQTNKEALLQADRERGFDLGRPPLTRVTLIRLEDQVYQFIWTFHLILLDGWSVALLVHELLAYYDAFCRGQNLTMEPPIPYGRYIEWLQQQDSGPADTYWQHQLKGFATPTPLGEDRVFVETPGSPDCHRENTLVLDEYEAARVQHFVRAHELTLNTVFQGVWAFQLGRRSGLDDVVFGSVVSGRQADFPGIASMVGLFINTLPVRVHLPPEDTVVAWLRRLQMQQAEARAWEFSSLVSIQKYSAVSHGQPLFESVLIFQNLPAIDLSGVSRNVTILDVRPFERNSYPLSLVIAPGPPLTIKFVYDYRRFNDATVAGVVAQFRKVLMQVVVSPLQPLSSIRANTEAEKAQLLSSFNESLEVH